MKTSILILLTLLTSLCYSQQVSHISINSSGGNFQNSSNGMGITIGELVIEPLGNDTISLASGFTNGSTTDQTTDIIEIKDNIIVNIYPNPTNDLIFIRLNSGLVEIISVKIFDLTGKTLLSQTYYPDQTISLDINNLAIGSYILTLFNEESTIISSYKILKTL